MAERRKHIPVKQPPVKFAETQKIIARIAERLDGVFISYWNNPQGSVCQNDVIAIYEMLENIGKRDTLYLFIKSEGGNGQASLRIVNLLRTYFTTAATTDGLATFDIHGTEVQTFVGGSGANVVQRAQIAGVKGTNAVFHHISFAILSIRSA